MKKILVLNLTRVGDLIQTTPLLAGLKEADPACEITMLANISFGAICDHLQHIDTVKMFDVAKFVREDGTDTPLIEVYRYLNRLVDDLRAERYDMLVNLSHSKLSAIFGKLLDIKEVRGVCATDDGFRVVRDPWLVYFTNLLNFRRYNSFNLVDLYQLGGGVTPAARGIRMSHEKASTTAAPLLERHGIAPGDAVIGVQAGASRKDRRWPPDRFGRAVDLVAKKRDAKVFLFGAPSERELGGEVAEHMTYPCINLVGETSLEELTGLVKRCDFLITNDTATMHIATAVGTPVIGLFFVHAFPAETGPYSEGNVTLEPDISCFPCSHHGSCPHFECFNLVTPEDVAYAADILPDVAEKKEPFVPADRFPNARAHATFFDRLGLWDIRPLQRTTATQTEIMARIYRWFFVQPLAQGAGADYWTGYLQTHFDLWPHGELADWSAKETERFRALAKSAGDAHRLLASMQEDYRKGKVERLKRSADKLQKLDHRIAMHGETHEESMPLVRLFQAGKENLSDAPLEVTFAKTKVLYKGILDATAFVIAQLRILTETAEKEKQSVNL